MDLGLGDTHRSIAIDETGLVLGTGTVLAHMEALSQRVMLDTDGDRLLALLSVAYNQPTARDILRPIEAAATHWQRGEKALANLRLVFAGLPRLDDPDDAYRLGLAETLLDKGFSPRSLMEELGLDPSALDLRKYDPDQPRIPAGSGRASGRWGGGGDPDGGDYGRAEAGRPSPRPIPAFDPGQADAATSPIIPVMDDGPTRPAGIAVVPHPGSIDPLDPQGLNILPPSPAEQQAISDTINTILGGKLEDLPVLRPHAYKNLPHIETGAVLPPGTGEYTTYYMRSRGQVPGETRLLIDKAGQIYYTNNHYKSFYPVDIRLGVNKK